ncbi:MAG: T9SS type A sorting domain-containing protein [Saprospiraceae bacterium]|nr:T9SS type A sorting domain-containing protein [Saprospiraceae bacterium]
MKWLKRFGATTADGQFVRNERFLKFVLSTDGHVLAVGTRTPNQTNNYTDADVAVAKFDLDGNEIWRVYFDWDKTDNGLGITALPDGEMIICGNTNSRNEDAQLDGFLMKLDANGVMQWQKTYGDEVVEDWLYGVALSSNQTIIATGTSQLPSVGNRVWALQTDLDGNQLWSKTFGPNAIKGSAIAALANGHMGIAGMGYSSATSLDNLVMELDDQGQEIWTENFFSPGPLPVPDELFDIIPCQEGGYAAVGLSGVDPFDGFYVLRVNANGQAQTMTALYDGAPFSEFANGLTHTNDGAILVCGSRLKPGGDYDLILHRIEGWNCSAVTSTSTSEVKAVEVQVSPNPASQWVQIQLGAKEAVSGMITLFDASGKQVLSETITAASFQLNGKDLPRGTYFYQIQLEKAGISTGTIVFQ